MCTLHINSVKSKNEGSKLRSFPQAPFGQSRNKILVKRKYPRK